MQIQIQYTGQSFQEAGKRVTREIREAAAIGMDAGLKRAAQIIRRMALNEVRRIIVELGLVRTGFLAFSMISRVRKLQGSYLIELTIRDRGAFYAFILNAGYPNRRTRGFMEKAFERIRPQMVQIVEREVALHIRAALLHRGLTPPSG